MDPFPRLSGGNSKAVTGTLASLEIQSVMTTNANHQNPAGEVRQLWSRTGLCDSITFPLAQSRGYQNQGLPPAPLGLGACWLVPC